MGLGLFASAPNSIMDDERKRQLANLMRESSAFTSLASARPHSPQVAARAVCSQRSMDCVDSFPRVVTAWQLVEESDEESIYHGPLSEAEDDVGMSENKALLAIGILEDTKTRAVRDVRHSCGDGNGGERRQKQQLVIPKGDAIGDNQRFICVFQVGMECDKKFSLVKRIIGKGGCRVRCIAAECNSEVRLRGIGSGSGFVEGTQGREANMPLQLNVSSCTYEDYIKATDRVARLLKDLYKQYRRYARSKNMEPPDARLHLEEVRRDDHSVNCQRYREFEYSIV